MPKFALCSDSNGTNAYVTDAQIYGKLISDSLGFDTFTNYSVSGYNSAQILTQVQAAIAAGNDLILMVPGTNDISSAIASSVDMEVAFYNITSAVRTAIANCAAAGKKLIVGSPILPSDRLAHTIHYELEGRLQALCLRHGVDFVPFTSFMIGHCWTVGNDATYDTLMRHDKWHMLAGMHALWHQFFMSRQHKITPTCSVPGAAVSITKTDAVYSEVNTSTYSFGGLSIGAANSTRQVVVAVGHFSGVLQEPSAVVIGGVTARLLKKVGASAGINVGIGLYAADIPTGTTATVQVYFGSVCGNCGVAVYSVLNAKTALHASASDNTLSSDKLSLSLAIPADGGAIAAAFSMNAGATYTIGWTGVTEDHEVVVGSGGAWRGMGSGSKTVAVAESATIESQFVNPASYSSLAAISFESL